VAIITMTPELTELERRLSKQQQPRDFIRFIDYQEPFYLSRAKIQGAQGGNRSGKTEVGAIKVYDICMHRHPTVKFEGPVNARAVGLQFRENVLKVLLPKFKKIVNKSDLLGGSWKTAFNRDMMQLRFNNGSMINFMSDEQGEDAHRGDSCHVIWIDEQGSEPVFNECLARIADVDGIIICTLTPEKGMTWLHDKYFNFARMGSDIELHIFSTLSNPYIKNRVRLVRSYANLDERTRRIKLWGDAIRFAGLVYNEIQSCHIIDQFLIPEYEKWNLILGIDIGLNNPTAVVFWAISPVDEIFQVDEIYHTNTSIEEIAAEAAERVANQWKHLVLRYAVMDARSATRRNEQERRKRTNLDAWKENFSVGPEGKKKVLPCQYKISSRTEGAVANRIMSMHSLLMPNQEGTWSRLRFTKNNTNTLRELRTYSYGQDAQNRNNPEKPLNVNDHAMTACEFVAESNPHYLVVERIASSSWDKMFKKIRPQAGSRAGII
jgi:phage terminase large subunit-like protein